MSDHQFHHQDEAAGLVEPLDERMSEYIKKLVRGGVWRKADILSRTKEYVTKEIFQEKLNRKNYFLKEGKEGRYDEGTILS